MLSSLRISAHAPFAGAAGVAGASGDGNGTGGTSTCGGAEASGDAGGAPADGIGAIGVAEVVASTAEASSGLTTVTNVVMETAVVVVTTGTVALLRGHALPPLAGTDIGLAT